MVAPGVRVLQQLAVLALAIGPLQLQPLAVASGSTSTARTAAAGTALAAAGARTQQQQQQQQQHAQRQRQQLPGVQRVSFDASNRHLFVDDALVERFGGGVGIRQGAPHRVSERPVLNPDAPWERGCLVYWFNSLLRNPANHSELRCYYYVLCPLHGWEVGKPGVGLNDSSWATFTALALSTDDGASFVKPVFNIVAWRGSTQNNFVIAGPGLGGPHNATGGQMEGNAVWYDARARLWRNQAKVDQWAPEGAGPGCRGYGAISTWSSPDGIHDWVCGVKWQPSPGRVDRQEVVYFDEDIVSPRTGERVGAYVLGTKSDLQNDVAKAPLMTRLFFSFDDPYRKADSVAGIRANQTVWGAQWVLEGTRPDGLDDSTHPRSETAGANQTYARWPVEFGGSQQWKVPHTVPPTYLMFAEMHWMWSMKCWKHDAAHDGAKTCRDEGCAGLAPEEPCQPVDVRLAVSRGGLHYTRQNATPAAGMGGRCAGMCDPEARRALIPAGREGSWYSRGVWVNPWPVTTADGRELRVFFHGRNVDNRNRLDPLAPAYIHAGFSPTAPVVEGVGYASFRPDGLMGLRAGYGDTGKGSVLTKPFLLSNAKGSLSRLLLNMNSGVGGEVLVAVYDGASATPLPGLGLQHAVPLTRDSLAATARWAAREGQPGDCCSLLRAVAAAGRPVRLFMTMEDAWVFSVRFTS